LGLPGPNLIGNVEGVLYLHRCPALRAHEAQTTLDEDSYLETLERLSNVMILFKLGYDSREIAILRVNSKRRYPEAHAAFEVQLTGFKGSG
jgi:hypothetical protein